MLVNSTLSTEISRFSHRDQLGSQHDPWEPGKAGWGDGPPGSDMEQGELPPPAKKGSERLCLLTRKP